MASSATTFQLENNGDDGRNVANFEPDIYGDYFRSFTLDVQLMERYNSKVDSLKEEVKTMFIASPAISWRTLADQMSLIDTIERLGLSYQFEEEIEHQLEHLFASYKENDKNSQDGCDLSTISLHFRLFRKHGHYISLDVFKRFTDENGKFMETLSSDVLGMLSMYEAAHLRIHGEDILEEALSFTTTNLNKFWKAKPPVSLSLVKQVQHALHQPLQRVLGMLP